MAGRDPGPLRTPANFWSRADALGALEGRDFAALFRLLAKYVGASQTQIAVAVGMTQGQISTVMAGSRRIVAIDVAERILDGLGAPDPARTTFGLAPRGAVAGVAGTAWQGDMDTRGSSSSTKTADSDVQRRDVLRIGGLGAIGAVAGSSADAGPVTAIARALTPYRIFASDASAGVPTVAALTRTVASAKRNYQACRYTAVLGELPGLLAAAQFACMNFDGDDRQHSYGLAADAYQVAGSVLLKLGDAGLAALAADRSMDAADRSGDPVVLAASARIVTHSLMSGGHAQRAAELAMRAAEHLDTALGAPTDDAISVYGALLLRGAVAAARNEDRGTAMRLLDEAEDAGRRLGRDDNAHWTGFGPTNVALHRVNVALALGDAGSAIAMARQIDLSRIELAERRATLFLDTAEAFLQWGKHDEAFGALTMAERIAPEEIRTRKSVHVLIGQLATRSPRTVRSKVFEFAEQVGVAV